MKRLKYPLLLIGVLTVEIALVYALFLFVTLAKPWYVAASVTLILSGIAYLAVSRYRERVKIKTRKEARMAVARVSLTAAGVTFLIFAAMIVLRALAFLVIGK